MHGGEQEFGIRAGTLSVHNIVGFGKAAEIALRDKKKNEKRLIVLDQKLRESLLSVEGIRLTVDPDKRLAGIVSIIVDKKNFNNERFLKAVGDRLALSTGSACSAGEPSYVITALGLRDMVSNVLRISLNKYSSEEDIKSLVEILQSEI